jgi:hypothetical protein
MDRLKKTGVGIAAAASLITGGGFVVDQQIDPYTSKAQVYEIQEVSSMPDAGENKITLSKAEPSVTLGRWNDEASLTIKYPEVKGSGDRPFFTNRIEWGSGAKEVHAYPLDAQKGMEDGGFEIEVILNEKPDTNAFDFVIEGAENFDFAYQSDEDLEAEEQIANGVASRPENVRGSYAVYHKEKKNFREGGINYATGKAYHIYRPKAIDANGVETWAELSFQNGDRLVVTVPQDFLDGATYPVRVDPTIGYTSVGASTFSVTQDQIECDVIFSDPGQSGVVTAIAAYLEATTTPKQWRGAIIDDADDGNDMFPFGGGVPRTVSTPAAWSTSTVPVGWAIDDVAYRTCFNYDAASGQAMTFALDTGFTSGDNKIDTGTFTAADTYRVNMLSPTNSASHRSVYAMYSDLAASNGEYVDTFTQNGTWIAPEGVTSITVEAYGAGGGGSTNVGGGGGGAYARSTAVSVSPGTAYTVTVGTSAANTNGGDSTFNSTTVVADGGLSGTNGGTGGLAANSTGNDLTYDGGNGCIQAGAAPGGGSAGDEGAGTNSNCSSGGTGAHKRGGSGGSAISGSVGKVVGGGGNSQTAAQSTGGRGEVIITYSRYSPDDYPYVAGRSIGRTASANTSFSLNMPSSIVQYDTLVAVITADGNPTIGLDGWTKIGQVSNGTAVTQAVFYKTAAGGDSATATTSASEDIAYTVLKIKNAGTPTGSSAGSGTSAPNPPSHDSGSVAKRLWIATAGNDFGLTTGFSYNFSPTATAPQFFLNWLEVPAQHNAAVWQALGEQLLENQTLDPGTFSVSGGSEEWVSWTISIPFSAQSAPDGGGNQPTGADNVWDDE